MQLRIDASQVQGLQALWAKFPEIMREELLPAVRDIDLELLRALKEQLPKGAGGLSGGGGLVGSIFTEEQQLADNVIGMVATALPYAEYVELGTKPHFPPLQPLQDWAMAKLGVSEEEAPSVAFLIARKIARVGTKADGTWQRVAESQKDRAIEHFEDAVDRVLDRLGAPS